MSALTVRSTEQPMAAINITPLIDVMLALLLIFMIAAPLVSQRLPLPFAAGDGATPKIVELALAADGQVSYNGSALAPMEVQAQLLMWASSQPPVTVQLRPDAGTPHQQVISLLALTHQTGVKGIALESPR